MFSSTWQAIRASDIDVLLSFNTPSVIRVRDRYLGGIYYLCFLLIGIYIFVYEIWYKKGYLITESPQGGNVRVSVSPPLNFQASDKPYCSDEFTCIHSSLGLNADESFPFIPTRYNVKKVPFFFDKCEEPSTMTKKYECAYHPGNFTGAKKYFLTQAEDYGLTIDHTVAGLLSKFTKNSREMKGSLLDSKGKVIQSFESEQDPEKYVIRVHSLLKAANVGLDEGENTAISGARKNGVFLLVYISYSTVDYSGSLHFTMKVSHLPGENSRPEEIYLSDPFPKKNEADTENYTVIKMNGITLQVRQVGKIGTFNFQTLLINIVAGSALLRVATMIVESLMIYCMPQREVYRKYKYHETLDFGDYRNAIRSGGDCHEMPVQKPTFHDDFPVFVSTAHIGFNPPNPNERDGA